MPPYRRNSAAANRPPRPPPAGKATFARLTFYHPCCPTGQPGASPRASPIRWSNLRRHPGAPSRHAGAFNRHSGASRNLTCGAMRFAGQTTRTAAPAPAPIPASRPPCSGLRMPV